MMSNKKRLCFFFVILIVYSNFIYFPSDTIVNINEKSDFVEIFETNDQNFPITVVSCYFLLNKSKFNGEIYEKWLKNFFLSVSSPLVLFTDGKSLSQELINLITSKSYPTLFYYVDSHWDILSEIEKKRAKNYTFNYKFKQNNLDPEKSIHNADLYLLWNMKSYITNKIAQENPFNSTFFIYTDSGAWRDKPLYNWPDKSFAIKIGKQLNERILFSQITNDNQEKNRLFPAVNWIGGGFFMGSKIAVNNFEESFWHFHDKRFFDGLFIGKDQTIMNIIAYKMPQSIVTLNTWDIECSVDVWFFYQYFLASHQFYKCKRPKEKLLIFKN